MSSLIFFGADQYSTVVLQRIIDDQNIAILAVVTDRAKPKDREQKVEPNPVEKLAITHNIKVSYYPDIDTSLINKDTLGLCASFDHLLPPEIVGLFHGELYNLHPSLLPQYRNVSPVQYALALGDAETGITLFRISSGIDNGEIVAQVAEPILPDDTTPTLTKRLFEEGAELLLQSYELCNRADHYKVRNFANQPLIFTHRLTRDSGYVEWPVVQKLLADEPISPAETKNELLRLRLGSDLKGSAQPRPNNLRGRSDPMGTKILSDLLRALTPWPSVWTICPTKKGNLRLTLVLTRSHTRYATPEILIAGKPKPILWSEFTKYYL